MATAGWRAEEALHTKVGAKESRGANGVAQNIGSCSGSATWGAGRLLRFGSRQAYRVGKGRMGVAPHPWPGAAHRHHSPTHHHQFLAEWRGQPRRSCTHGAPPPPSGGSLGRPTLRRSTYPARRLEGQNYYYVVVTYRSTSLGTYLCTPPTHMQSAASPIS